VAQITKEFLEGEILRHRIIADRIEESLVVGGVDMLKPFIQYKIDKERTEAIIAIYKDLLDRIECDRS